MKHSLIIYGKKKGHGTLRKNELLYSGPIPEAAAINVREWVLENLEKEKS